MNGTKSDYDDDAKFDKRAVSLLLDLLEIVANGLSPVVRREVGLGCSRLAEGSQLTSDLPRDYSHTFLLLVWFFLKTNAIRV